MPYRSQMDEYWCWKILATWLFRIAEKNKQIITRKNLKKSIPVDVHKYIPLKCLPLVSSKVALLNCKIDSRRTPFDALFIMLGLALLAQTCQTEAISTNIGVGNSTLISCIEEERDALLRFREGLEDDSNFLSSWNGHNCCNWIGVGCSNHTGHVVTLDLHRQHFCTELKQEGNKTKSFSCTKSLLGGKLNPSLLDLKYLSYLNLKGNDFQGTSIPQFVGSLQNLRNLDLSESSFAGMVPPSLGNLSQLQYLDLNTGLFSQTLWVSDLYLLTKLSSLRYLNLGSVNLSNATAHWLQAVNMLPSLLELHLPLCKLHDFPHSTPSVNFTSVSVLDLSFNSFDSTPILQWCFNISTLTDLELVNSLLGGSIPKVAKGYLCNLHTFDLSGNYNINGEINGLVDALSGCSNVSLEVLNLSFNRLTGNLPHSLGSLKHLRKLDLSSNSITGSIPKSFGNLSQLEGLDLSFNAMNGTIRESIGQLSELRRLDLSYNSWEGIITEVHFMNLSNLKFVSVSAKNTLVFEVPNDWIPTFNLYSIQISGCQLGPAFPEWLKSQTELETVTLANAGISGTLPSWFWKLFPKILWLKLSGNNFKGDFYSSPYFSSSPWMVDLSFNKFEGSIPLWPNVTHMYLQNNLLAGPIPLEMGQKMPQLKFLDLSGNFLNGSIPPSASKLTNLMSLHLSNNSLSGEILSHWENMTALREIDLSRNNFSGKIPSALCSLPSLHWLKLSSNYLSGELSPSLKESSSQMSMLDLGENRFSDTIPKWIGQRLSSLRELRLRHNLLTGSIPEDLCQLTFLHILDLAHNNFSGPMPACLDKLVGFHYQVFYSKSAPSVFYNSHHKYIDLVMKGRKDQYADDQIPRVKIMDFSGNNLSENIPAVVTNLSGLVMLNLSWNHLSGGIPNNFGDLKYLETLDLSCNHLEGPIPTSITSLTFLSHLNLSNNNLSGPIPSTNQFETFNDPSIYEGNPGLCGSPLPIMCSDSEPAENEHVGGNVEDDEFFTFWFYVSMGLGFIVGFWAVFGGLAINKSWRESYFRFLDDLQNRILLHIAMNGARFRRIRER